VSLSKNCSAGPLYNVNKVQLSGNETLNKKVLSSRRKVRNDEAVRRDSGRVFHAHAAAQETPGHRDWIAWSPAQTKST